jgi:hypothetical protein
MSTSRHSRFVRKEYSTVPFAYEAGWAPNRTERCGEEKIC